MSGGGSYQAPPPPHPQSLMEAQLAMASRLDELYDAVALLTIELQQRDRVIAELEHQLSMCECVVSDEGGFHSASSS